MQFLFSTKGRVQEFTIWSKVRPKWHLTWHRDTTSRYVYDNSNIITIPGTYTIIASLVCVFNRSLALYHDAEFPYVLSHSELLTEKRS